MQIRPPPTTHSKNTLGGRPLVQCPGACSCCSPQGKSQQAWPCTPSEAPSLPQTPHHTGLGCLAKAARAWAIGTVREKCQGRKRARAGFSWGKMKSGIPLGLGTYPGMAAARPLDSLPSGAKEAAKVPCLPSKSRSMKAEFSNCFESCGT